jgi:hypothetical protein
MDGGNGGHPLIYGPYAVRKALVVMHDIIPAQPGSHKLIRPESESKRLRKTHGGDPEPFNEIERIHEFVWGRDSEWILGIV